LLKTQNWWISEKIDIWPTLVHTPREKKILLELFSLTYRLALFCTQI